PAPSAATQLLGSQLVSGGVWLDGPPADIALDKLSRGCALSRSADLVPKWHLAVQIEVVTLIRSGPQSMLAHGPGFARNAPGGGAPRSPAPGALREYRAHYLPPAARALWLRGTGSRRLAWTGAPGRRTPPHQALCCREGRIRDRNPGGVRSLAAGFRRPRLSTAPRRHSRCATEPFLPR